MTEPFFNFYIDIIIGLVVLMAGGFVCCMVEAVRAGAPDFPAYGTNSRGPGVGGRCRCCRPNMLGGPG